MMMNTAGRKLTLDEIVTYKITVSGYLEGDWSCSVGEMATVVRARVDGPPESTIAGKFDQAALHGFLGRLYSLGYPLISVDRVEEGAGDQRIPPGIPRSGYDTHTDQRP